MSSTTPAFSWTDIWRQMPREERLQAMMAFVDWLRGPPEEGADGYADGFVRAFARRVHFRLDTLRRMSGLRLARLLSQHFPGFFDHRDCSCLFQAYYLRYRTDLMCRFLDLCGIAHDERGMVTGAFSPPDEVRGITDTLVRQFSREAVLQYYRVLLLHGYETWRFLEPELAHLGTAAASTTEPGGGEMPGPTEEESAAGELIEDFTQLDRVLIEQIVITAAGEERALSPDQLFDLVDTVIALNTRRERSYFHLGFMAALVADFEVEHRRPEMNDARRQWYLAGLLAGLARRRDIDAIDRAVDQQRDDFERAAARPGGAGLSMARTLLFLMLETDRLSGAVLLLRGQVSRMGRSLREQVLAHASQLLRQGSIGEAKALLSVLHDPVRAKDSAVAQDRAFCRQVVRKLGQAFLAGGERTPARQLFEKLLQEEDAVTPDLLADMGLLEAGFGSLGEIRIEGDEDSLNLLAEALKKGRGRFEQAIARFPSRAHHAHYLLAVIAYLDYMRNASAGSDEDALRRRGIQHAQAAISGMIGSPMAVAYESMGLLGQARFMLAVLHMAGLDEAGAAAAMQVWKAIPAKVGRFPLAHLESFLVWAELADRQIAMRIAESIHAVRGAEALDLLVSQPWAVESDDLRTAFLEAAADPERPRAGRFDLWGRLVPALVERQYLDQAGEGLDAMEGLAMSDERLARRFVHWLGQPEHYDPVWDEADALRARYRCQTRCGDEVEAVATLRLLFHALKEERPEEALQIRELVRGHERGRDVADDLVLPHDDEPAEQEGDTDIVSRLASGEAVRVLFVGGNETQRQYDERIRSAIRRDWPGVEVVFEHTGWSSNWGAMIDRLKREARDADAVVLMSMMRTMLGRTLRAALNEPPRPWVPCNGTGRDALERSIRRAAEIGLRERGHDRRP